MMKKLIINADDCGLTRGVTRAILGCHDAGIVTSATVLVNQPLSGEEITELRKRRKLGLGVHLNVTFGRPVSNAIDIGSLLTPDGIFLRPGDYLRRKARPDEIFTEYKNQVERFRKIFGRLPTHLDTHHQLHDRPPFDEVFVRLARFYRLPGRRSRRMPGRLKPGKRAAVKTTEHLFGYLDPKKGWTRRTLKKTLTELPPGISEIFCHPGENDEALREVSSLTVCRQREAEIFSSLEMKDWIREKGIRLIHYGML